MRGDDRRPRQDGWDTRTLKERRPSCDHCGKTCYPSEKQAKQVNRHARFRFRTYYCTPGRAWHVMNMDKR